MDWESASGRFITEDDVANRTKVCVLGSEVASELFQDQNPVGKTIKIARGGGNRFRRGGRRSQNRSMEQFTVVGVMTQRGRSLRFGWNLDDRVFLPLTTVQERFTGNDRVTMISVQAKSMELVEKAKGRGYSGNPETASQSG